MNIKIKEANDYVDQLTWLRGIAAFFVIVSHTLRATEVKYASNDEVHSFFLMSFFDLGSFGVVIFFALSGCTLYISSSKKFSHKDILAFYTKRFFRIWPAFVVSLALYIGFGFVFSAFYIEPQNHWIEKQFLNQYTISDVFRYLSFTFNITGPGGLFNNAYWSLPVEFQYYIIFPVIVASLRFGALGPVFIGILLYLLPKLGIFDFDRNTVFTLAFSFCGGVLVGYVYKRIDFRMHCYMGILVLTILVSVASAIANSYFILPDAPIVSEIKNWYAGLAIIAVFIALVAKIKLQNKIEIFLKHYGTISYSTYLYHNLFIAIAILLIVRFQIYDSSLRLLFTFVFTLVASYFFATMSYVYIEKTSIAFGRRIIKKHNNAD